MSQLVKQRDSTQDAARTHQSLARGLRILETIALNGGRTSLAEMARSTGLHRSTAHHLLQTLVGLGYLSQDSHTRGYELSAKLFQLTGRTWTSEQLCEIAEPLVAELARASGEGACLAVYRNGCVRIIAKREAELPVRVVQDISKDRPMHATAVGKAIMAWLPAAAKQAILAGKLERFTPRTIVSSDELSAEIVRIRSTGVAFDDEEHFAGIRCIAAPIFSHTGQVVAALCAVGPRNRMTRQKLKALRMPLIALSRRMSERLGWCDGDARPIALR